MPISLPRRRQCRRLGTVVTRASGRASVNRVTSRLRLGLTKHSAALPLLQGTPTTPAPAAAKANINLKPTPQKPPLAATTAVANAAATPLPPHPPHLPPVRTIVAANAPYPPTTPPQAHSQISTRTRTQTATATQSQTCTARTRAGREVTITRFRD